MTVDAVSDLEALTDAQFECKLAKRHIMRVVELEHFVRPRAVGYRVVYNCELCGRVRNDVVNGVTGELLDRWYPKDNFYRWTGDRILINDLRLEKLRRLGVPTGLNMRAARDGAPVKLRRPRIKRGSLAAV